MHETDRRCWAVLGGVGRRRFVLNFGMSPAEQAQRNELINFYRSNREQAYLLPNQFLTLPELNKLVRWLGVSGCQFTHIFEADGSLAHKPDLSGHCYYKLQLPT